MNFILEWLFSLTAAGSVVVAFTLFLRFLPADSLPAIWRYRMGQLALGCFLIPLAVILQWVSASVETWFPQEWPVSTAALYQTLPEAMPNSVSLSPPIAIALLGAWAGGAAGFAVWHLIAYRRFTRILEQSSIPMPTDSEAAVQLASIKEVLTVKREVRLLGSHMIRTPLLVGLWRPTIYLPTGYGAPADLSMVLRHELIHLKHKDLWIKAFMLAVSSLQWFNPLVYMLRKEIHTWSELSCDAAVVRDMSRDERKRYGETILGVMSGSKRLPTQYCATLSSEGQQLKRRLTLMLTVKKVKKKNLFFILAAVLVITALSTTAAVWAADHSPQVSEAPAADPGADTLTALPEDTIAPASLPDVPAPASSPADSALTPLAEDPNTATMPAAASTDPAIIPAEAPATHPAGVDDKPAEAPVTQPAAVDDIPAAAPVADQPAEALVVPADESGDPYISEDVKDAPPSDYTLVPAEAVK